MRRAGGAASGGAGGGAGLGDVRLVLFTRFPTPGRAKTRLIPALGAAGAASVHRTLAERAMATLRTAGRPAGRTAGQATGWPVEVRTTGAPAASFRAWLGAGCAIVDQGEGDLGARLARAGAPTVLVGADAPGMTVAHLRTAAAAVAAGRFAIGPAADGGYWLLGVPVAAPFLFADMPWSTDAVFGRTMAALAARGIAPAVLPVLADVDRPEDLAGLGAGFAR